MNTIKIILFSALMALFPLNSSAQVYVEELLQNTGAYINVQGNEDLDQAQSYFNDANEIMNEISMEESRIEQFFEKSKKKGERKSVGLKQAWVEAANLYQQGFELVFFQLSNKTASLEYAYEEDNAMVKNLSDESFELAEQAREKLVPFEDLSNREYKKDVEYYSLVSELNYANQLWVDAIEKEKQALRIHAAQAEKKKKEIAEINAWQTAISENTLSAYKTYLFNFPEGKHREEAEAKIKEFEEMARKAEEEQEKEAAESRVASDTLSPLLYRIQLIAVSKPLTDSTLKKIYDGKDEIFERNEDGLYKYSIGKFDSFKDAKNYRKSLNIESFIVAFKAGRRIPLVEAIALEKEGRP